MYGVRGRNADHALVLSRAAKRPVCRSTCDDNHCRRTAMPQYSATAIGCVLRPMLSNKVRSEFPVRRLRSALKTVAKWNFGRNCRAIAPICNLKEEKLYTKVPGTQCNIFIF